MNDQRRSRPVAYCIKCHAPSRAVGGAESAKCERIVDRKGTRCGGVLRSAQRATDWRECRSCGATGMNAMGMCTQCRGEGWLLVQTRW
jgi:hypothetical protein